MTALPSDSCPPPHRQPNATGLVAIVVAIDDYHDVRVPDLSCAVNDAEVVYQAILQTQPAELLELTLLTSPQREKDVAGPTKENVLTALARAAESAGEDDTIVFYFAGHGILAADRVCLAPADVCRSRETGEWVIDSLIGLDEVQSVFENHPARRRVMLLDCCQSDRDGRQVDRQSGADPSAVGQGEQCGLSGQLVTRVRQQSQGWTIVFSCGPNEVALEDAARASHGLFSLYLATGLRGGADLNCDGIVSLPELIQYLADRVPAQAEAVIAAMGADAAHVVAPGQQRQEVTVIWDSPVDFPLTHAVAEGRAGFQASVVGLWWRQLFRPVPYPIHVQGMFRYGVAVLYGCVMALTVILYAPPEPTAGWGLLAGCVGIASACLWNTVFSLASAANQRRWHAGGYLTAEILLAWHVVVFCAWFGGYRWTGEAVTTAAAFLLGFNLFVLISLMVIFGVNAAQFIISLADLHARDDRVTLWRVFTQLDEKWGQAEVPNNIAMVSGHPRLYQLVGSACCLLIVVHAVYTLVAAAFDFLTAMTLTRDSLLIVLVQWQVQWIAAAYRKIYNEILPAK